MVSCCTSSILKRDGMTGLGGVRFGDDMISSCCCLLVSATVVLPQRQSGTVLSGCSTWHYVVHKREKRNA